MVASTLVWKPLARPQATQYKTLQTLQTKMPKAKHNLAVHASVGAWTLVPWDTLVWEPLAGIDSESGVDGGHGGGVSSGVGGGVDTSGGVATGDKGEDQERSRQDTLAWTVPAGTVPWDTLAWD